MSASTSSGAAPGAASRSAEGPGGSVIDDRAPSLGRLFLDRVAASPDRESYRRPVGDGWQSQTWRETGEQVARIAAGLLALGLEPEQRVGIAAETRLVAGALEGFIDDVKPVVQAGGSDTATLDNVFELLVRAGRDAPMAKALLIPASIGQDATMPAAHRELFSYCNAVMEPWDGPAAITATDGRWVIAGLDRNGLVMCRAFGEPGRVRAIALAWRATDTRAERLAELATFFRNNAPDGTVALAG